MNHRMYLRITDKFTLIAIPAGFLGPLFIVIVFGINSLWLSLSLFISGLVIIIPLWRYLGRFKVKTIACPECRELSAVWHESRDHESRYDAFLVCSQCGEVDRIKSFYI